MTSNTKTEAGASLSDEQRDQLNLIERAVGKIFGGDHLGDSVFLLRTDLAKATP